MQPYDVALILVGAPLSGSRARFYTREALSRLRGQLAPPGFATFVRPASESHRGPDVLALQAAVPPAAPDALGPPLLVTLGGRLLVIAELGTPRWPEVAQVVARATQVGPPPPRSARRGARPCSGGRLGRRRPRVGTARGGGG